MKLSIQNISFERNYQPLFSSINSEITSGDCLQIQGANGSGKSTFLKIVAGFIEPLTGAILWNHQPIVSQYRHYQHQLHYIGHKNSIKLNLTVYENLKLLSVLQNIPCNFLHLSRILKKLNLADCIDRLALTLSAGQLRRLSLARLLLTESPLWILDEPLASLDKEGQHIVMGLVDLHLAQKGALLIATHQPLLLNKINTIDLGEKKPASAVPLSQSFFAAESGRKILPDKELSNLNLPQLFHSLLIITFLETKITLRCAFSWLTPLLFFIIVVCIFPLAVGENPHLLRVIAPGILWVTAFLAIVISIEGLFRQDEQEGYLVVWSLSPMPITLVTFCKILSHWLTHCAPLILISPLLGYLVNLNPQQWPLLVTALVIGTPTLSLLGAVGAALITSVPSQGLLLPILIMPLYLPVLILGTSAMMTADMPQSSAYFALLGALLLLSLVLAPLLAGAALKGGPT